ncbi:hypothetical protein CEXT_370591 [Caerostris extrusa]|uniref:Uncharacterized protein n=1 Tax=Caerostris extrusa TaxID=172846 RepID=A0AAV4Y411_CAEEX|nr:hypothetical protein CEXT_370591 [Caerostris extrusa]
MDLIVQNTTTRPSKMFGLKREGKEEKKKMAETDLSRVYHIDVHPKQLSGTPWQELLKNAYLTPRASLALKGMQLLKEEGRKKKFSIA